MAITTCSYTHTYLSNACLRAFHTSGPLSRTQQGSIDWVASIHGVLGEMGVIQGPCASETLIVESIALHHGINPQQLDSNLWSRVPSKLSDCVGAELHEASIRVGRRSAAYATEPSMLGAILSSIGSSHQDGGWTAQLEFVEFSSRLKEHETGADFALIVSAKDGQSEAVKTIWLQAKRAASAKRWQKLPRLSNQIQDMARFTSEAFGVVLTPEGAVVVGAGLPADYSLRALVGDVARCRRGDQSLKLLADTVNRKAVLRVLLQGPQKS